MIGVTKAVVCVIQDDGYKRTLAVNREKVAHVAEVGFLSHYLRGPLLYV